MNRIIVTIRINQKKEYDLELPVHQKIKDLIRKSLNICTVVMGVCTLGIGLLWCIPIRKKILNRIDRREPVSNGLKIAATWVGMIPGLLLLVNEDI